MLTRSYVKVVGVLSQVLHRIRTIGLAEPAASNEGAPYGDPSERNSFMFERTREISVNTIYRVPASLRKIGRKGQP